MTIDAPCPNCGTVYTIRRELIGKRTKCTRCGTPFVISEVPPTQAPPTSPPPPPEQGLFTDIPIHPSYAPHATPPEMREPQSGRYVGDFFGFEQHKTVSRFPVMKIIAQVYAIMGIFALAVASY